MRLPSEVLLFTHPTIASLKHKEGTMPSTIMVLNLVYCCHSFNTCRCRVKGPPARLTIFHFSSSLISATSHKTPPFKSPSTFAGTSFCLCPGIQATTRLPASKTCLKIPTTPKQDRGLIQAVEIVIKAIRTIPLLSSQVK